MEKNTTNHSHTSRPCGSVWIWEVTEGEKRDERREIREKG